MNIQPLTRPGGPWLHALSCTHAELSDAARQLGPTRAARVVRGARCLTVAALFDEFSAALQFPLYFGHNWDAFSDCLCDLAWIEAEGYVLFVADALRLLEGAKSEELGRFFAVLKNAAEHWGRAHKGKGARSFDVVLHAGPADGAALGTRCKAGGVTPTWLK